MNWTTEKPVEPGAYWVRGFNIHDPGERALVEVLDPSEGESLLCNLHMVNSEPDFSRWYPLDKLRKQLEWCGPLVAAP